MKKYEIDVETSKELYEKVSEYLKFKACFDNTFECILHGLYIEDYKHYKVAFGLIKLNDELFVRHCFLLKDDKVVDVTSFFWTKNDITTTEYYKVLEFEIEDYINKLKRCEETELRDYTLDKYFEIQEELFEEKKYLSF